MSTPKKTLLSIVMPVYNEKRTFRECFIQVFNKEIEGVDKEIIIVESNSTDGTRELVRQVSKENGVKVIYQDLAKGKGNAVRAGLQAISGDIVLIQDADLEYDPRDYPELLKPIQEGLADVVYGSRFLGGSHRVTMFWHMVANRMLTFMTNILYNTILTDMETGYKVFKRQVIEGVTFRANSFDFEPEFTAKILKRNFRIFEVPITFNPRDYTQGKKIKLHDAFEAVWTLIKYRFVN